MSIIPGRRCNRIGSEIIRNTPRYGSVVLPTTYVAAPTIPADYYTRPVVSTPLNYYTSPVVSATSNYYTRPVASIPATQSLITPELMTNAYNYATASWPNLTSAYPSPVDPRLSGLYSSMASYLAPYYPQYLATNFVNSSYPSYDYPYGYDYQRRSYRPGCGYRY